MMNCRIPATVATSRLILLHLMSSMVMLSGCTIGLIPFDVTYDTERMGAYRRGQRYEIIRDVFLMRENGCAHKHLVLAAGEEYKGLLTLLMQPVPHSVEAYEQDPDAWSVLKSDGIEIPIDVRGIVRAGTIIEIRKGVAYWGYSPWYGPGGSFHIYARIETGPYTDTLATVDELSVFQLKDDGWFMYPEPGLLKKLSGPDP